MLATLLQTALLVAFLGYLVFRAEKIGRDVRRLRRDQERVFKELATIRALIRKERATGVEKVAKTLNKYFNEHIWPQIQSLDAINRLLDGKDHLPHTRRAAASPDILLHLVRLVRANRPQVILECGSGTSTVALAMVLKAFGQEGHVFSIENDADYAARIQRELEERKLQDKVTIIVAPLVEKQYSGIDHAVKWYDLDKSRLPPSFDLLFVDGPEGTFQPFSRYPAGPELLPLMSPRGRVILDDADREAEAALPGLWANEFPGLQSQPVRAEKGAAELFWADAAR